jgi:hypothetical protein
LTSGGVSFRMFLTYPTELGSLTPSFEVVMKWAYLKMPNLCLPKANA